MRVERIRKEAVAGRSRVTADVIWEDREEPSLPFIMEVPERFADDLDPSADACLLALFPLAQWHGESRIRVEGTICSCLRDGLSAVTETFAVWFDRCRPLAIEATEGFAPAFPRDGRRAASFLSGGIDALSLLRLNQLEYPATHPGRIKDCIILFGVGTDEFRSTDAQSERLKEFHSYTARVIEFHESAGITVIPYYTNIRSFYPPPSGWKSVGFGSGMVSSSVSLSRRIDRISFASAGLGTSLEPQASHPAIDHYYSTAAVSVYHSQPAFTRFEKTRIVAEWPEGLAVLRPCLLDAMPTPDRPNCGQCEKCVRTMLGLLALGKLRDAPTFPFDDVTPEMLEPIWIDDPGILPYYEEMIEPLRDRGRSDLAASIGKKMDAYRRWRQREKLKNLAKRARGLFR